MHAYILRTLCTPVRTLCAPVPTSVYECFCLLLLTLFSGFFLRLKRKKRIMEAKKKKKSHFAHNFAHFRTSKCAWMWFFVFTYLSILFSYSFMPIRGIWVFKCIGKCSKHHNLWTKNVPPCIWVPFSISNFEV